MHEDVKLDKPGLWICTRGLEGRIDKRYYEMALKDHEQTNKLLHELRQVIYNYLNNAKEETK